MYHIQKDAELKGKSEGDLCIDVKEMVEKII
jgi:hypothetical protein